ncbi:putative ribosomally synthesized peptide [Paenibacillus cellulosilyticus]|uniref:Putative ribosomally synthesized peptide n=1 Tax=Paenibacillus cellulosilyticus TaxID=375489 RepID=A0A2V2YW15_9BACL|nr:NHLP leader peptide family RiPP precursor [Paenibacillus cellulosilyticus]PWW05161.1 putative ribosomally synthesized peptide [Paenibacillus cellulosilyticus]QKS48700.1 NHLP leader peptide family natural product precursor [Paenibacillus cellulosilyticus]
MSTTAIISKAWEEPDFKKQLLDNPIQALKQAFGITMPEGSNLKVVEETKKSHYLVIPPRPENALTAEENVRKFVWI